MKCCAFQPPPPKKIGHFWPFFAIFVKSRFWPFFPAQTRREKARNRENRDFVGGGAYFWPFLAKNGHFSSISTPPGPGFWPFLAIFGPFLTIFGQKRRFLGFFGPFPPGKRGGKAGKSTKMGSKMSKILGPGRRGNRTEIRRMSQNLVILAREKWMLGRMGPKGRLVPSVHLFSIKLFRHDL